MRMEIGGSSVRFYSDSRRRVNLALLGTWAAHLNNMITGVTMGWEARMKIVYSHFPIKLVQEGKDILVQNFLGEKKPRVTSIVGDTKVDIKKDEVIISGISKEDVGQSAANIELATKITGYDRRVFQDGCYIVQKCKPVEGHA
jgi:large subunit ribosomal protein L6